MEMSLWEVLQYLTTTAFGATSIVSILLYRGANKRVKYAEAALKEEEVKLKVTENEKGVVDNYERLVTRLEGVISGQDSKYEKMEAFHQERYEYLNRRQSDNEEKVRALTLKIEKEKVFLCTDLNCKVRKRK